MSKWIKADGNTDYSVGDEIEFNNRRGFIARKDFGLCAGDSERLYLETGECVLSEKVRRVRHI